MGDNKMAYKYTIEQAVNKAIVLDKLTDQLKEFVVEADRNLEANLDDQQKIVLQANRDISDLWLQLIVRLESLKNKGEVTT